MTIQLSFTEYDRILYEKNPSRCMDCKEIFPFEIRSNKRCIPCFTIERDRKIAYVYEEG